MPIAGKDTVFKHGTHAATSVNTDYTTSTRSVSFKLNGEEVDATTFGNAFRDYEPSYINGTVSVTYKYSTAMITAIGSIITNRDTVTWELGPTGSTAGEAKISGSMIPTGFDMNLAVGVLEEFTQEWRVTDTVTFGAYS